MIERCNNVGNLVVGGQVVGLIRCIEDAGHERATVEFMGQPALNTPTPHRAVLEWVDDAAIDWPEALDPDEGFDTEVPAGLCGVDGCVYLDGHVSSHSWQV